MQNSGPSLTVDAVIFSQNRLVLIKRANPPFTGSWALPGGFVEIGESVENACIRETKEETGLEISDLKLIGVYSNPNRDPRRHTVSVAFLACADLSQLNAGDDASEVAAIEDWQQISLAFDHRQIVSDAWALITSRC